MAELQKEIPKHRQEGEDRSAFQIGEKPGEGGQRDIQTGYDEQDETLEDEFTGMAATGEQNFATDGQAERK